MRVGTLEGAAGSTERGCVKSVFTRARLLSLMAHSRKRALCPTPCLVSGDHSPEYSRQPKWHSRLHGPYMHRAWVDGLSRSTRARMESHCCLLTRHWFTETGSRFR